MLLASISTIIIILKNIDMHVLSNTASYGRKRIRSHSNSTTILRNENHLRRTTLLITSVTHSRSVRETAPPRFVQVFVYILIRKSINFYAQAFTSIGHGWSVGITDEAFSKHPTDAFAPLFFYFWPHST